MADLIVIAGPTASGKTALSLPLAEQFNAEIISADARQFYRKMDIGTAKPTPAERAQVPHHFVDILNPEDHYTAGQYEKDVMAFLDDYFTRKQTAILVGGSGLYLKAITDGFDDLPSTPPEVRAHFDRIRTEQGLDALAALLQQKDPAYHQTVDLQNPQRVQRALEAMEVSGKPFSTLRTAKPRQRPFRMHLILLQPPREMLYRRINTRVDEMVAAGLVEEARALLPLKEHNALQTVGYQELFDHFEGKTSLAEAVEKIKQHTRNFAKRQITWFKRQEGYQSFEPNQQEDVFRHLHRRLNV